MTDRQSVPDVLRAARRRVGVFLAVFGVAATMVFASGVILGGRTSATAEILWGSLPVNYSGFLPPALGDVNRAERFFNEAALEDSGFQQCNVISRNVGLPVLNVHCSGVDAAAVLSLTGGAVELILSSFNDRFDAAQEVVDRQRILLQERVAVAEEATAELEDVEPEREEQVEYHRAVPEWRRALVEARLDLVNFDVQITHMRRAETLVPPFVSDSGRSRVSIGIVSVVVGLILGLFAAVLFAAFDVLGRQRRRASEDPV